MPCPCRLAVALLLSAAVATAQPTPAPAATDWSVPYAAGITPEALRQDLSVLASDAYEGRETGQKGQKMAADYLAKAFAAAGLAGPVAGSDNTYLQHFSPQRTVLDVPASTLTVNGRVYQGGVDFYPVLETPFTSPLQPVFIGYGIREGRYNDFATAHRTQGRDVVLLAGEPLTEYGKSLLTSDGQPSAYAPLTTEGLLARAAALAPLGMRSIIVVLPSEAAFRQVPAGFKDLLDTVHLSQVGAAPAPGFDVKILLVSPAAGARLLGTTPAGLAQYRQVVSRTERPLASPFHPEAGKVLARLTTSTLATENVLGYLAGGDLQGELVVVSAHYDHLGTKNGVVYNGADDDGSGTVSVLALARAFAQAKKDGHGPRRSLLFLANTGEEEDLLGSEYYTEHPVFPLASTITDLNIDMVGRADTLHQGRPDYVYLVGDDKLSSELHALSEATNQQYQPLALDYKYNDPADPEHLYERSDHYNFAKHGVPVIFYTSGLHRDYHAATDDVDKIDFPALARRAQLVFHTAWVLANRPQRPAVDSHKQ